MNVYVRMSISLFILSAFLHVYTICSIIVCFGMSIRYTLCTLQKEEIKNIYLSTYYFFSEKVSVPLINLSSVYYAKPNEMILRSTSI